MSKLSFSIAPIVRRGTRAWFAPSAYVVHKPKSRFCLCVALASAIAFLAPFAVSAFAMPSYDLIASYDGERYAVETGLAAGACEKLKGSIAEIEVYPGLFLDAKSADLTCELAR